MNFGVRYALVSRKRLPLQVRLRVLERILPEHCVTFPDRPDVGDQHVSARRQPEHGEQRVEVRVRESGLQFGVRHARHGGADVAFCTGVNFLPAMRVSISSTLAARTLASPAGTPASANDRR